MFPAASHCTLYRRFRSSWTRRAISSSRVLLREREDGGLDGRQERRELEQRPLGAADLVDGVGRADRREEEPVDADRRLDDLRDVLAARGLVHVLEGLARRLLVLRQVVAPARRDALQLLLAEREPERDVRARARVVGQVLVHVLAQQLRPQARAVHEPGPARGDPLRVARAPRVALVRAEVLDLHLLELPRPEDEVARRDLVAEGLADLRDAARHAEAPRRRGDVLEVHEDALRRLRAQVGRRRGVGRGADARLEHEVERPRAARAAGPVGRARRRHARHLGLGALGDAPEGDGPPRGLAELPRRLGEVPADVLRLEHRDGAHDVACAASDRGVAAARATPPPAPPPHRSFRAA